MAQTKSRPVAKIYDCPVCSNRNTASQIKKNNHSCPNCMSPLKHEMVKKGGSMSHEWVVDEARVIVEKPEVKVTYKKVDIPPAAYDLYEIINKEEIDRDTPEYKCVYRSRYGYTDLRCPRCGSYLHTTNFISGNRQAVLCRSTRMTDSGYAKCKTRTLFIFLGHGEHYDPTTG